MTHANDRINEAKKPLHYVKAVMVIVTGHSRRNSHINTIYHLILNECRGHVRCGKR